MEDLVTIAKIAKTRGLRGELVADILTDFPERFDTLRKVFVVTPSGKTSELEIEKFWFQNARIILKFVGFDSIEAAEKLRDSKVCVSEVETVKLETDEFFEWHLTECFVETIDGISLGKVSELMRTGGTEILVVKSAEKDYLIPFAKTICVEVDIENKLIKVDVPEGLLEF